MFSATFQMKIISSYQFISSLSIIMDKIEWNRSFRLWDA